MRGALHSKKRLQGAVFEVVVMTKDRIDISGLLTILILTILWGINYTAPTTGKRFNRGCFNSSRDRDNPDPFV
jgi:hypothetical protein